MKFEITENRGEKIVISFTSPLNCVEHGTLKAQIYSNTGRLIVDTEVGEGCDYVSDAWFSHVEFLFFRFLRIDLEYNGQKYFLERDQKYANYQHLSNFLSQEEIDSLDLNLPEKLVKGSTNLVLRSPTDYIKQEEDRRTVLYLSYGHGQGDVLLFEPTLRKISESLNRKISVVTKRPEALFNHPCIDDIFLLDMEAITYTKTSEKIFRREENYDVLICRPNFNMPFRWGAYGHTERAANFLGFNLRKRERNIKFFPIQKQDYSFLKEYVVCCINVSSPVRFWSFDKWNKLFKLFKEKNIKVAIIGTPYLRAYTFENNIGEKFLPDHSEELDTSRVLDLTNKSLEENYNIINSCKALITTDTAAQHLCGATDAWLFLIGSTIHPEVIMPWRQGSQEYKAVPIIGDCELFCSSNLDYSLEPGKVFEETNVTCYSIVDRLCLEGFDEPKCHPRPEKVFNEVLRIYK